MAASTSLARRASLAVVLMIGFYLLGLIIASGLLLIPYGIYSAFGRYNVQLTFFCVASAGAILWSLIPRPDYFEAPGPALTPDQQPQLFEEISHIAHSVGQEMPAEVYLVPEVNAWVMQRGGVMGFGSRRVMGLGLPLLQLLSRSELRAVLAHEFGHYHGGDTKLGPWIYKTRSAIVRTIHGIAERSTMLQKPFIWYGNMFMRITHAISRQQEFTADSLAAKAVGSKPLGDGLKLVHGGSDAFNYYWHGEVAPVLDAGYRPPFVNGFARLLKTPEMTEVLNKSLEHELKEGQTDAYDTHPPLRERLSAISTLPDYATAQTTADEVPAVILFNDLPALENELFKFMFDSSTNVADFKPLAWEETGVHVFIPIWEKICQERREELSGLTPHEFPDWAGNLVGLGKRLTKKGQLLPEDDEVAERGVGLSGAALAVLLYREGATVKALPGEPVRMEKDGIVIEPFGLFRQFEEGKLTAEQWRQQCEMLGISSVDLGATGTPA